MHIAINAATANAPGESGTVTWERNLLRHLLAGDRTNRYTMYTYGEPRLPYLQSRNRVTTKNMKPFRWVCAPLHFLTGKRFGSTLQQMLAVDLLVHPPDVYFQTGLTQQPQYYHARSVITLFDVIYLIPEFAQYFTNEALAEFHRQSAAAVAHATHILTISEHSKQDIISYYHYPAERITVISPGVDRNKFAPQSIERIAEIRRLYGLTEPYMLYVGWLHPRKNVQRLMEACRALKSKGKLKHRLVIAGPEGWLTKVIHEKVAALGLTDDVQFLGQVPDEALVPLISGASLLALPSLYEGFGLPLVEAMACGVPVLAANVSSMPEVVGEAGLLLDPYDTNAWAEGIDQVMTQPELRLAMIERGFRQIEQFSWERTAEKTISVLEYVGASRGSNIQQKRQGSQP